MTTLTLDPVQIEKVVSSPSDAGGSYRDVWFFGDIVIKKDDDDGHTNRNEYEFYQTFQGGTFMFEGEEWEVILPETSMVGDYIIMEKVEHPHLVVTFSECEFCVRQTVRVKTYNIFLQKMETYSYKEHDGRCKGIAFIQALDTYMSWYHYINDTHEGNFMVDAENNRVYFVDFAQ